MGEIWIHFIFFCKSLQNGFKKVFKIFFAYDIFNRNLLILLICKVIKAD